ncbi:MAG: hypothetical protein RL112_1509 [Planctomycetota bacterium]|jgi:uncharacterized protein YaeQ
MAHAGLLHRFAINLADADRGVYETLELRTAMHASESELFLVARVLGYCLCHEEGIAFGRGLCEPDEAAISVRDATGRIVHWIEVGMPAAERLHKAMKAVGKVTIVPHRPLRLLERSLEGQTIHKVEEIEVLVLDQQLLSAVAGKLERNEKWDLTTTDGTMFLVRGNESFAGAVERTRLFQDQGEA